MKVVFFVFLLICIVMLGLYIDYSGNAVGHIYAMWLAYLFRGISQ